MACSQQPVVLSDDEAMVPPLTIPSPTACSQPPVIFPTTPKTPKTPPSSGAQGAAELLPASPQPQSFARPITPKTPLSSPGRVAAAANLADVSKSHPPAAANLADGSKLYPLPVSPENTPQNADIPWQRKVKKTAPVVSPTDSISVPAAAAAAAVEDVPPMPSVPAAAAAAAEPIVSAPPKRTKTNKKRKSIAAGGGGGGASASASAGGGGDASASASASGGGGGGGGGGADADANDDLREQLKSIVNEQIPLQTDIQQQALRNNYKKAKMEMMLSDRTIKKQQSKITRLEEEHKAAGEQNKKQKAEVKTLKKNVELLRRQMTAACSAVNELTQSVASLRQQMKDIKTTEQRADVPVGSLSQIVTQQSTQISSLRAAVQYGHAQLFSRSDFLLSHMNQLRERHSESALTFEEPDVARASDDVFVGMPVDTAERAAGSAVMGSAAPCSQPEPLPHTEVGDLDCEFGDLQTGGSGSDGSPK